MLARFKALEIGLILVIGLCTTQQVMALSLGELTLESNLEEPLDATIELRDVTGLEPGQISVSLATPDDFTSVGAELTPLAETVQFNVEVDGPAGTIHLTTTDNVTEPFLDLILNVSWPDGALRREYTVLLDLPGATTFTTDTLPIIPSVTDSVPSPESSTSSTPEPQPQDRAETTEAVSDNQQYSVASGDSMWEIAAKTRPGSNVNMHQMMLAIQRANPEAFINNNINRVLSGRVLRIPTLDEINLVDQATAAAEVNQQNQQLGLQPLAVNRSTGNNNAAPEQDELTVLTDDQSNTSTSGNGDLDSTLAGLENEMMLSEEGLDRARLENTELTSRFKMLEDEMDLLQNLIVMEDARIAQLQADLASQAQTTEQALATTEAATDVLAAQQPEPQPGVLGNVSGWLQNTAVMLGVIVALFLLILGYLFWQRRRMTAAAYAFDSGIPELETAKNTSFTTPEKPGGGIFGLFSRNKSTVADTDIVPVTASVAVVSARGESIENFGVSNIDLTKAGGTTHYLDDEQMVDAANHADVDLIHGGNQFSTHSAESELANVMAMQNGDAGVIDTEVDDAAFADALIAEAKEFNTSIDESPSFIDKHTNVELTHDEKEAHELAELVTPDVAITDSGIPESFEFTLTTAPEALAEKIDAQAEDIESFDFQLSSPSDDDVSDAIEADTKVETVAKVELNDEELLLNALLLDEEDSDFHANAPMNECDTKLDLAVAYEAMGDIEGAVEILNEVLADGDKAQIAEANRLKGLWQNS
ncbi:MAG: FimV/HubP family polar landmark protein [Pseudomonadota bacterium]